MGLPVKGVELTELATLLRRLETLATELRLERTDEELATTLELEGALLKACPARGCA